MTLEDRLSWVERTNALPLWAQEALQRIVHLEGRLEHVNPAHHDDVASLINSAAALIVDPLPRRALRLRFSNWWNGTRVERAWAYLHEAELRSVEHADDYGFELALDTAIREARVLDHDDPARVQLEEFFEWYRHSKAPPPPSSRTRRSPRRRSAEGGPDAG